MIETHCLAPIHDVNTLSQVGKGLQEGKKMSLNGLQAAVEGILTEAEGQTGIDIHINKLGPHEMKDLVERLVKIVRKIMRRYVEVERKHFNGYLFFIQS
ncbi:hypothetical protein Lal_00042509 [Lupinus albus]|nr:hypothetical protein Lal_00042509 [Lupinus albus]